MHIPELRSPGSAERGLPRDRCHGGGLGPRSPILHISHIDTENHRLPKVRTMDSVMTPPAAFAGDIFWKEKGLAVFHGYS